MSDATAKYIYALRFASLTRIYDPLIRVTTRERVWRAALIAASSFSPGQSVLDVGCGTGTLLIQAKQQEPSLTAHGVDGDPDILRHAMKKSRRAAVEVRFQAGMSFALPYRDGSFDRVLSSLFFHHLTTEDKRRTLREMYRVTGVGGALHVADWGVPQNRLMRVLYVGIQLLDGFDTTSDNVHGLLPKLITEAGFIGARLVKQVPTMFGTLAVYSASKAASVNRPGQQRC